MISQSVWFIQVWFSWVPLTSGKMAATTVITPRVN